MKKLILAFFLLLSFGCASTEIVPILANRTLRISPDKPGFEYHYNVCTRWFLGACTKTILQVDYYDLTDPVVRKQLIDMGFVLKVREKIQP